MPAGKKFGFGQSVVRKEDDPLLRGRGRYIADAAPRGTLHAVVLRSPHAHARLRIDAAKARAMPGVRLVLTGAETADLGSPAVRSRVSGHRARGAALSDPRAHGGAPCRGCGCLCRRRYARAREGRRRGACGRLGTAAARDRRRRGAQARRAAGLAAASRQYRLRRHARRCDGNQPAPSPGRRKSLR